MADSSKRNSVAGKVATPKTAPTAAAQSLPDMQEALGKAIGARIKVTTAAPNSQTHDGTLWTASPMLNVIAINTRNPGASASASQPGDFHIIPISQIQSFQVISLASIDNEAGNSIENAKSTIGPVDLKRLRQRLDDRVQAVKEQEQNQGKGVTKEAQEIYNSFKRINMPIRWHNQEMIVHDTVIITPPYRPEDCKGARDKQEVLSRVRKVLEGERRKLKEKEERERKPAATAVPRKGG